MRKKILIALVLVLFLMAGCAPHLAHLQLESGTYPNEGINKATAGAALGVVPGIILRNEPLAWGGALALGALGSLIGSAEDKKSMEEARKYRLMKEQEWKETYKMLAATNKQDTIRPPRVIVVNTERHSPTGWQYSVIMTVEQGLRQRAFDVVQPPDDYYRYSYRRVATNYNAYNADFLAEVLLQDLDSAVKVTITLRSLTGKSALDRQGVGKVAYSRDYSREERRERAATLAAKKAVANLFISKYGDTLEATGW